jgi:transketolase
MTATPTQVVPGGEQLPIGPRRAVYVDAEERVASGLRPLDAATLDHLEDFDLVYRSLCALMFNYVPTSGHPGGSISSGRIVQSLLFGPLDYDFSSPDRADADIVSYAAGHKALGLYALWALRNEVARIGAPELLPKAERDQLRLEDLLGFRRNPITQTPLFRAQRARALDGHPTPATPFVRIATGASGVGLTTSVGLAWAAADLFGEDAPRVHIIEGEGGLTPGRVSEALAAAGAASLGNIVLHVDWNQASIDSNRVCRDGDEPGDYVQWTPAELCFLHDWNVVYVPDGIDFQQIAAAQQTALELANGQPTAIVYRTKKGWRYGIEGAASHGAGHPLCSESFYAAVAPLTLGERPPELPRCDHGSERCGLGADPAIVEECYWQALQVVRRSLEERRPAVAELAARLREARERLDSRARRLREGAPRIELVYESAGSTGADVPETLRLQAGSRTTLRDELGKTLGHLNRASSGAIVVAAADLLGSTSVSKIAESFPPGYYNWRSNPGSRVLSIGGICEDAMSGVLSGISSFGHHIGVGSSYGAFNAALGHVAARLHAIGNQAGAAARGARYRPFFLVCAHAGLKTGEDGPTHADPQPLQLLQGNFPPGTLITLTPWDPQELWFVVSAALAARPCVIAPFVTRPPEMVIDRAALGLAPASAAVKGVYRLVSAQGEPEGAVVLQGSAVTYAFLDGALPRLREEKLDLNIYYVASAELFDLLAESEREEIFPERDARLALGITDFTAPTMDRWLLSERGRRQTLHPFRHGHYLGSGPGRVVLEEAGLDGESQFAAIRDFVSGR